MRVKTEEDIKRLSTYLFGHVKRFKHDLITEKDLKLYIKIDNILWFDWDPLGLNNDAPRSEYQSYTPIIFDIIKNDCSKKTIIEALLKLEMDFFGGERTTHVRRSLIANKILK